LIKNFNQIQTRDDEFAKIKKSSNQNQTRDDEIAKLNDIVTHAAHT
jgi:hypothetical protein